MFMRVKKLLPYTTGYQIYRLVDRVFNECANAEVNESWAGQMAFIHFYFMITIKNNSRTQ